MAAMRLCLLAVFVAAGLVAASTPAMDGCPSAEGDYGLYDNNSATCDAATTCQSAFMTCQGTAADCASATACIHTYISCMQSASSATACTQLGDLHLALLSVAAGDSTWMDSAVYKSGTATSCSLMNETHNGDNSNCTLNYDELTPSTVSCVFTVLLKGDFSKILDAGTNEQAFSDAIAQDASTKLDMSVVVNSMTLHGSTLAVEMMTRDAACAYSGLRDGITSLAANADWLVHAGATYSQINGGGSLTVTGAGAGHASSAFSSFGSSSSSSATTKTSGAIGQSLVAAAAVAALSALLF